MINPESNSGFLLINKPKNKSSYDCIRHIKKILKQKVKIGHAGTLDVFASGLMLIAIGRQATKKLQQISDSDKEYMATGKLGEETDTQDNTGNIIKKLPWEHITKENLEWALNNFFKHYEQTPPIYSALKHKGSTLYSLARTDKKSTEELEQIVENKKRIATLKNYKLISFDPPYFTIKVTAPKGTYIRTLINDIGKLFNSCACTHKLIRTKIGDFTIEDSCPLDLIKTIEDIKKNLLFY